jgi:hypothetical protein
MPLPGRPQSHVSVDLTDADEDEDECVLITIHGVKHCVHASTAFELQRMLESGLKSFNSVSEHDGAALV